MAVRTVTLDGQSVDLTGNDLDFQDNRWRVRAQQELVNESNGQWTDAFTASELTTALTTLGSRTITTTADLDDYLKDISQELMETKYNG